MLGVAGFIIMLAGIYLALFLIGALIPKLKWLIIYSVIVAIITGFLLYDTFRLPEGQRFDSPFAIFGLAFLIICAWGVYAGIITRAITIFLKRYTKWPQLRLVVTALGMLSLPLYYAGDHMISKFNKRGPSAECDTNNLHLSLSGHLINVAPFDIFSFNTSDGSKKGEGRMDGYYGSFSFPSRMREYCAHTDDGKQPLAINQFNILFNYFTSETQSEAFRKICANPLSKWPREKLCQGDYPLPFTTTDITLFDNGKFDQNPYDQIFANKPTSYQWYTAHQSDYVPDEKYSGFYQSKGDTFWISKNIQVGNEPLSAMCGPREKYTDDWLYCKVTYPVKGNIYVEYYLQLSWQYAEENALKTYKEVNYVLESLGF